MPRAYPLPTTRRNTGWRGSDRATRVATGSARLTLVRPVHRVPERLGNSGERAPGTGDRIHCGSPRWKSARGRRTTRHGAEHAEQACHLLTGSKPFPFISTDNLGNEGRRPQSADWRSTPRKLSQNTGSERRSHCRRGKLAITGRRVKSSETTLRNAFGLPARSSIAVTWRYRTRIERPTEGQRDDLHVNSTDSISTGSREPPGASIGIRHSRRPRTHLRVPEAQPLKARRIPSAPTAPVDAGPRRTPSLRGLTGRIRPRRHEVTRRTRHHRVPCGPPHRTRHRGPT